MVCGNANKALKLNESESSSGRYILEGLFAGPFGVENRNKRIYQVDEYLKHLQYLRDDIKKGEPLLGELDHTDDRFEVKMKEVSHRILDLWYDKASNTIQGKLELLNTPNGKLAQSLVDQGVPLHISSRAAGSVNNDKTVSIQQIYTFDLVCKPGFAGAVLHRVNESEGAGKYSDDVYKFLTESERAESLNTAPQFGMMNEDVSITEVQSDIKLREEAKKIKENNTDDMNDQKNKTTDTSEDVKNKISQENGKSEAISEKDDDKDIDTPDNEEGEDVDNTENDGNEDSNDEGVEIISVRAETDSDSDDEGEGVEIDDVKSDTDSDEDDNNDKDENNDNGSDEEDDKQDESKDDGTDEKKVTDTDDKEKEMLLDCDELKKRKDNFEEKLDNLIDSIKNKNEKKKTDESHTINQYPISSLLNKKNFSDFMSLDESQKNNVISYLQDNRMIDIESVNENWRQGISYEAYKEPWFMYAPEKFRKLYENASEDVKASIKSTASFVLFENQYDVNRFWENTGIEESASRNILNENFMNTMPKIVAEPVKNELPYSADFIKTITEMACEYT